MSNHDDKRDDETTTEPSEGSETSDSSSAPESTGTEPTERDEANDEATASKSDDESGDDESTDSKHDDAKSDDGASSARMSAGARLAAQKAAKALQKSQKKAERIAAQREGQPVEAEQEQASPVEAVEPLEQTELGRATLQAGAWWEQHAKVAWGAVAAAAVGIAGILGYRAYVESQDAAAGTLLRHAVEVSIAPVTTEPAEDESDDSPRYETNAARSEAALEAYRAVLAQYPTSAAAPLAKLGEGRALLVLGQLDEARAAFQAAFDHDGGSGVVAWQALEGVGFVQEAQSDLDGAQATYERLAQLENHAYENVANYHLARLRVARDDEDGARTAFREVVEGLQAGADEPTSEPAFPYVLAQAQVRLRELDPSAAGAAPSLLGPGGGDPSQQMSPEQLQELIRQFQARGGAAE